MTTPKFHEITNNTVNKFLKQTINILYIFTVNVILMYILYLEKLNWIRNWEKRGIYKIIEIGNGMVFD